MTRPPRPPPATRAGGPTGRLRRLLVALLLSLAGAGVPAGAPAQEAADDTSAVERARRLTGEGAHRRAASLLAGYLESHPEQARVRWLYARTLYWSGRTGRAREQYERALGALPDLAGLRLDYARFLLGTNAPGRAREILEPVARGGGDRASTAEARGLWARAARATAPWMAVGGEYRDDNQPLRSGGLTIEAGVHLGPRVAVSAEGQGRRLAEGGGDGRTVAAGRAALEVDWPGSARTRVAAGRLRHDGGGRRGWVGEAELALDLGSDFRLTGSAERWNYRHTATALDTALFAETAALRLRRERPTGWAGAAGGRVDRFPDGNRIRSAYFWVLAPVWSGGGDAFRLGYAFRAADAERTTFRATEDSAPTRPGTHPPFGGTGGVGGVYTPYYTPEQQHSHSAVAALQVQPTPAVLLAVDGAVGIHATERAPQVASAPTAPSRVSFASREYRPWRIHGRLRAETSPSDALTFEAGYREDAFFRVAEASLGWTHWFAGAVPDG